MGGQVRDAGAGAGWLVVSTRERRWPTSALNSLARPSLAVPPARPPARHRGELVRSSVAEAREARYRAQARDCYLFNLDDQHVLDSTLAGGICRFTVGG